MNSQTLEVGQTRFWHVGDPDLHFKIVAVTEHRIYYKYLNGPDTTSNFHAPNHLVIKDSSLTYEYLASKTIKEWLNE
jgi:hypothetical protein